MSGFAWGLVIAINGAIIGYGLWRARETHRSIDWFLAAKGLPWWIVGLSLFATAVDSGDYVAVAGSAYKQGLPYLSAWWLGLTIGWLVVAYVVFVPMYRTGMFTNAEYLEYRFGPSARVISVFIQLQSRTNVLANVAFSLYLIFTVLTDWGEQSWWLVIAIAVGAAVYTSAGGLRSVAVTDAMQSVVMFAASVTLWWIVWSAVGGWSGLESGLAQQVENERITATVAHAMTHVGGQGEPGVPPWLVVLGFVIVMTSYCVINQSQAMRMLAARSVWDMKMAAVLAAGVTVVAMWFNVTLGILGRVAFPDLATVDEIYPQLVRQFLLPLNAGLTGIVVAGLFAGGISTYDSVGSALSSVFTRDLYARFLVKRRDDRHYLRVSRVVTFVVIALSFAYVPFLGQGMVALYLKLVGVGVVPLMTIYVMGVLTRVGRSSGTVGLVVGIGCGLTRFADPLTQWAFGTDLPFRWTNFWWGYLWSIAATAAAMVVSSILTGWADADDVAGLVYSPGREQTDTPTPLHAIPSMEGTWLETSHAEVPPTHDSPFSTPENRLPWFERPGVWAATLIAVVCFLNLYLFW